MAYQSNGKQFYNSEDFIVKSIDKKYMCLTSGSDDTDINVDIKLSKHFKPMYAMTVHKSQGATFNRPCSIYAYKRMKTWYVVCCFN